MAAQLLAECEFICERDCVVFSNVAEFLKRYYGETFAIENTDPEFGQLTSTNGIIRMVEGKLEMIFNIRFGKDISAETIRDTCGALLEKKG